MQILAIEPINIQPNLYTKQTVTPKNKNNMYHNNSTNLMTPAGLYNKIQFTGGIQTKTMPELIEYMEKTVKPFLEEYRPMFDRANNISKKMTEEARDFLPGKIEFKPAEFREAKRLRLDELDANIKEFLYLFKKSDPQEKFYSTEETNKYALDLLNLGMFRVPLFVRDSYEAYVKMITDTTNGLKNMTLEALHPDIAKKKSDIYRLGSDARMGLSGYGHTYLMNKRFSEYLQRGITDVNIYREFAKEAERGIETHKVLLPDIEKAIADAEKTYNTGMFIEYDYDLLRSIPKRAQRVINRNAKKFNDIASKTELDANEEKQLDDIIKSQKELIEDLWNRIETDKKDYFKHQAYIDAEFRKQALAEEELLKGKYGEDIPF